MSESLSARRAWIEILLIPPVFFDYSKSLSARRAWIEIIGSGNAGKVRASLSARRAWIEISGILSIG